MITRTTIDGNQNNDSITTGTTIDGNQNKFIVSTCYYYRSCSSNIMPHNHKPANAIIPKLIAHCDKYLLDILRTYNINVDMRKIYSFLVRQPIGGHVIFAIFY